MTGGRSKAAMLLGSAMGLGSLGTSPREFKTRKWWGKTWLFKKGLQHHVFFFLKGGGGGGGCLRWALTWSRWRICRQSEIIYSVIFSFNNIWNKKKLYCYTCYIITYNRDFILWNLTFSTTYTQLLLTFCSVVSVDKNVCLYLRMDQCWRPDPGRCPAGNYGTALYALRATCAACSSAHSSYTCAVCQLKTFEGENY